MINYTQICHTSLRTAVSLRAALNKHDTRQSVLQTFISLTKTLVLKKDKQFTSNKESLPPQLTGPIILLGNLPAEVASSTAYWLWVHQGLYCLYPFWSTDRRSHLKKVNENWLAESVRSNDRLKIGRRSEWALYFIRWLTSVKFEFQPSFLRVSTFNRFNFAYPKGISTFCGYMLQLNSKETSGDYKWGRSSDFLDTYQR